MPTALDQLLVGLIDYAGLFPPAGLPMDQAVPNYASYLRRADRQALGRFIVPAGRLPEFEAVAAPLLPDAGEPWQLAVLVGENTGGELEAARAFNARGPERGGAVVDVLEGRAGDVHTITRLAHAAAPAFTLYVEVPSDPDPTALVGAIGVEGVRAKIRTGGVTPEMIPDSASVARFLDACIKAEVMFKATAGLHHPIRGSYPLTYEPGSPRATMHGYLNVFLAAALLTGGGTQAEAVELLEETDLAAFGHAPGAITWRGHELSSAHIATLRRTVATGFGSCSFDEPLDDLRTAGWLA